ncbi:MAG: peptidase prepilin type [Clostridia bacterium]|nr:peptidase prepilin type [Clostridia bacterium]
MEIALILLTSIVLAAIIFLEGSKSGKLTVYTQSKAFLRTKYGILSFIYILITILLISKLGFAALSLLYAAMLAVLFVISVLDTRDRQISKKGFAILMLGGFAAAASNQSISIVNSLGSMLSVFAVLWIIYHFSKGSIGMGDVRLCAATALYLGIEKAFGMLALATIMSGVTALILILLNKAYRNESMPFAPFIAAGTAAVLLL